MKKNRTKHDAFIARMYKKFSKANTMLLLAEHEKNENLKGIALCEKLAYRMQLTNYIINL